MVAALVGFSEGHRAAATISAKTHDQLETNQEFRAYGIGNMGAGILGGMAVTGSLSKSSLALDLLPAMIAGIVLSIIYLIHRTSFPGRAVLGRVDDTGDYDTMPWQYGRRIGTGNRHAHAVPGVIVYRFQAPLIFSNAEPFEASGKALLVKAGSEGPMPTTMVIDCEAVAYVDTTGAAALTELLRFAQRSGTDLALARLHANARKILELTGAMDEIGDHRIHDTVRDAVNAATEAS